MTELQVVQLLGIMYTAIGVGFLVTGPDYLKAVYANFAKSPGLMLFGGFLSAAVGYAMVIHFTTWDSLVPAIATVVGWAALIKGVMLLAFPAAFEALCHMMISKGAALKVASTVILALGLALLALGFEVIPG
ncbi:MAG: hypothetical protein HN909_01940 [Phycisphaerales bacterium]|jgi:hypothetical protein|nr:hypothetical protein [Phycisphaerales bacterium]MBT7170510.1 hypothetical protein [Phycisphaerales bacterium]